MDRWSSRTQDKGEDPYWSYITLCGRDSTLVTIISAYRVSQRTSVTTGVKTAYMQQCRTLLSKSNTTKTTCSSEPNKQFITDLQSWIQFLQKLHHLIILSLDNNEDLYSPVGQIINLPYKPDQVKPCKNHDGLLMTLVRSCGLINILSIQHSSRPFPPTYIRGRKRLDYMLVSTSLQDSVIHSGILPYHSIFLGDHHPCFIDFDAAKLFAGDTPPL